MNLIGELKRRNVFRVGAAYVVVGWLLLQVADVLLGNFGAPDWVFKSFAAVLLLGFPLALFLAWAFELTPEGVKRTEDVPVDASIAPQTRRRLDRLIIVALLGVIVLLVSERIWLGIEDRPNASTTSIEKSIAVLPFSDFSPSGDNEWFADGLSEEILNSLVRVPDLMVAARTSSFNYRDSNLPISEIGEALEVAHVLEGSIRLGGDRIRVTAQLIRTADGFHIWSNTFDQQTADMIGIQEELARQIAEALETTMDPDALAEMAEVGTQSVEAYQAYIRGRAIEELGGNPQAYEFFEEARAIDPEFSAAHFRAARFWQVQSDDTFAGRIETGLDFDAMAQRFNERMEAAARTANNELERRIYQGWRASFQLRFRDAMALFEAYLADRPGDSDVWFELMTLANMIGEYETVVRGLRALEPMAQRNPSIATSLPAYAYRVTPRERAGEEVSRMLPLLDRWPENALLHYQLHRALLWIGDIDQARRVHDRILRAKLDVVNSELVRLRQACAEGRTEAAAEILKNEIGQTTSVRWLALLTMNEPEAAEALLKPMDEEGEIHSLASYLVYPQFDATRYPSIMRVLEVEGVGPQPFRPIPFACPRLKAEL